MKRIGITAIGSISALGSSAEEVWASYSQPECLLKPRETERDTYFASSLSEQSEASLSKLKNENRWYRELDRVTLFTLWASRSLRKKINWHNNFGVIIGSARGATHTFEADFKGFNEKPERRVHPLTSPTTTLGNISSWVAQDLQATGIASGLSMTCSSALHALLQAMVWIESGRISQMIVGGAEAPLTNFTFAQMAALRILAGKSDALYPSQPMGASLTGKNTVALGEGAALFAIEPLHERSLAEIAGLGFAIETIENATSINGEGIGFETAMRSALENMQQSAPIDVVLAHAPGTAQGDKAELDAIRRVFGSEMPVIASNKWMIGHTLGASGAFHLELALHILQTGKVPAFPYGTGLKMTSAKQVRTIMINSAGFGGNVVSVIIRK